MINVTSHAEGAILPVWARPGARSNRVLDEHDGALRVGVVAAPEGGRANDAIVEVLAETLNLKPSQISLIGGATARAKRFLIAGLSAEDLLTRIESALEPTLVEPPDADV